MKRQKIERKRQRKNEDKNEKGGRRRKEEKKKKEEAGERKKSRGTKKEKERKKRPSFPSPRPFSFPFLPLPLPPSFFLLHPLPSPLCHARQIQAALPGDYRGECGVPRGEPSLAVTPGLRPRVSLLPFTSPSLLFPSLPLPLAFHKKTRWALRCEENTERKERKRKKKKAKGNSSTDVRVVVKKKEER